MPFGFWSGSTRIAFAALRLSLLVGLTAYASGVPAAIPASERTVLLNLYYYTQNNGSSWANGSGWGGPPGTECSWYGITCDSTGQTVVAINLAGNLLSGRLPPITDLKNLENFNVGGSRHFLNTLVGPVPSLSGLTHLRTFDACCQFFTGPIPSFDGLSNLERVDLGSNLGLTGTIPALAGSPNLQYFDVRYNELTGTIPDISGLSDLQYFRVDVNDLTGTLPTLSEFPKLTWFGADVNRFTGTIPQLSGLKNLQNFSVSQNQLSGSIPALSGLSSVLYLLVDSNHLTGGVPDLGDMGHLEYLTVGANQLGGSLPAPPSTLRGAFLCPNELIPASDPPSAADLAWNAATRSEPWSAKCSQTPQATWMSLHTSAYVVIPGQPVTITAFVYGSNPTGRVTFSSRLSVSSTPPPPVVLCENVPLVDGVATCPVDTFGQQTVNLVTAAYSGDANNAASTYDHIVVNVAYGLTETLSANSAQAGQPVDLVAKFHGVNAGDTATVWDGRLTLCAAAPLTADGPDFVAHCTATFSRVGPHSLLAKDNNALLLPRAIPVILDVTAPQAFDADQSALTGSWYNIATSGQGLTLQVYPDFSGAGIGMIAGGWFTYDAGGDQRWLWLQGNMSAAHGASFDLGVYESSGGNFDAPPMISAVDYGTATLTFYDCAHAALIYHFLDGRSGTIAYSRLTASTECSNEVPPVTLGTPPFPDFDALHSGNWFNPATSGQGLVIDVVPSQTTIVATWYTYAPQSEAQSGEASERWFYIQAGYTPGDLNLTGLPIYAAHGGAFDDPKPISFTQVGTADMTFTSCEAMTLHYAFTQGEFAGASGTIAEQTVGPVPAGCH
jgi:hypothetical protein